MQAIIIETKSQKESKTKSQKYSRVTLILKELLFLLLLLLAYLSSYHEKAINALYELA